MNEQDLYFEWKYAEQEGLTDQALIFKELYRKSVMEPWDKCTKQLIGFVYGIY